MTVLFQPDQCLPRDPAGWGFWLNRHADEHARFANICATGLTPPVIIQGFDLRQWTDDPKFVQLWLQTHEAIHEGLRQVTNVGGIDLSLVDLSKDDEWYLWMDDHATEHDLIRQELNAG